MLAFTPRIPVVTPVLPGPGSDIRMKMGWKVMSKTEKSGVWFFQNAGGMWERRVLPLHTGAADWVRGRDRTTQRGRFQVVSRVPVRIRPGGPSCRAAHWRAVLATASRCVEGCRTPDEALVC